MKSPWVIVALMSVCALAGCKSFPGILTGPEPHAAEAADEAANQTTPSSEPAAPAEPGAVTPEAPADETTVAPTEPGPAEPETGESPTEAAVASSTDDTEPDEPLPPSIAPPPEPEFSEYRAIDEVDADDPLVMERVVQTDVSYPIGIIGAVEPVFIIGSDEPFRARVDTGATTSSVDAENIQFFERDGREWVSFEIVHRKSGDVLELELPVKRRIAIKRQEADSEERFVIDLTIRIGKQTLKREFSLADRSEFEYSILIGRNVLRGMAIVDVAQQNTLD